MAGVQNVGREGNVDLSRAKSAKDLELEARAPRTTTPGRGGGRQQQQQQQAQQAG